MLIWLIIAVLVGVYMAWNIGSNDVANSMASAVGAKAITLKQAIIIAGILNFLGAVFVGSHVTETIRKGIVDPSSLTDPTIVVYGTISALLAASFWVTFATWKELPVSTTHSVVGGLLGFGIVAGGSINWGKVGEITAAWIISPIFGCILAFTVFNILHYAIINSKNSIRRCRMIAPLFIGLAFFIIALSFLFKTPLGKNLSISGLSAVLYSGIVGILAMIGGYFLISRYYGHTSDGIRSVESTFRWIQVFTSCYVAFSHGSNDVANAIGPVATIYMVSKTNTLSPSVEVPFFLLAIGGMGIALGIYTWGYKVIDTVGRKITELTNTRGFTIDFSAATTVLLASKMGLPISTTHAVVGSVIGVGLARGLKAIDLGIIKNIILSWVITLPAAALITIFIFKLLTYIS
ncbi:MAG TPA: inorganic phosphate transporter [Methanomicrobia archaeon]|nr:inorganic phosphate transporter [Methanomicrobia archaeon]